MKTFSKIIDFGFVLAAMFALLFFLGMLLGIVGCTSPDHVTIPTPAVVYPTK